jgi:hypothetical protein
MIDGYAANPAIAVPTPPWSKSLSADDRDAGGHTRTRPEPACEAGEGEQVGQGACYVALVDGALVDTIMFKPVDRTGGSPRLNRPDEASLGQLAAPERQPLKLGGRLDLIEARTAEMGAEEIALDTAGSAHLLAWHGRRATA